MKTFKNFLTESSKVPFMMIDSEEDELYVIFGYPSKDAIMNDIADAMSEVGVSDTIARAKDRYSFVDGASMQSGDMKKYNDGAVMVFNPDLLKQHVMSES